MSKTNYSEAEIEEFKEKYKKKIWLENVLVYLFAMLVVFLGYFVPDRFDTFGYFDNNGIFYYFYNISGLVESMIYIVFLAITSFVISYIFKRLLKGEYEKFMVAKSGKNINQTNKVKIFDRIAYSILLIVVIAVIGFSIYFIKGITVTEDEFSVKDSIFTKKTSEYTFDYFENKQFVDFGGDIKIWVTLDGEKGYVEEVFTAGKNSPYFKKLVEVIDEKSGGIYKLYEKE